MLYRPDAFEPLTDTLWDEGRVRDAIRRIVADTDAAMRGPKLMWRAHDWDRWSATSPMKNLYVGAAGLLWGLDKLRERGYAETTLDLADLAQRNLELFRDKPDYIKLPAFKPPEPRDSSLFLGEAGILLLTWRLVPSDELANDLYARVQANVDNPAEEIFWGVPGSLIAASDAHMDGRRTLARSVERPRRSAARTLRCERPLDAATLWPGERKPDTATRPHRHCAGARAVARRRTGERAEA